MYSHSLQLDSEPTGGTGINRLFGLSCCIWNKMPASVTTRKVSHGSLEANFNRAAVLPTTSATAKTSSLHSGWANTLACG